MVKRVAVAALLGAAGALTALAATPRGASAPVATTCVNVGPVYVDNQQVLDQYGVCLPV